MNIKFFICAFCLLTVLLAGCSYLQTGINPGHEKWPALVAEVEGDVELAVLGYARYRPHETEAEKTDLAAKLTSVKAFVTDTYLPIVTGEAVTWGDVQDMLTGAFVEDPFLAAITNKVFHLVKWKFDLYQYDDAEVIPAEYIPALVAVGETAVEASDKAIAFYTQ